MKRAVVISSLALVCGLLLGWLVGSGFLPPIHVHTNASAISPAVSPGILSNNRYGVSAAPEEEPLDTEDNTPLLDRAGQALEALKEKNYAALSRLVHPERGVTLTPYSTVDPSCDNVLTQAEVARLSTDEEVYTWGLYDGSGEPIRCTGQEYFDRYETWTPSMRTAASWSTTSPASTPPGRALTGVPSSWCLRCGTTTGIWWA